MKIFILICALAAAAFGQTPDATPAPATKFEQFSARSGSLTELRIEEVGVFRNVLEVSVLTLTDLLSGMKISGLRFKVAAVERYKSDRTVTLDADEVDAMMKSFTLIGEKMATPAPAEYTEIRYRSRDGMTSGCYSSNGKWTGFVQVSKYDADSIVRFNLEDLPKLRTLVEAVRDRLVK